MRNRLIQKSMYLPNWKTIHLRFVLWPMLMSNSFLCRAPGLQLHNMAWGNRPHAASNLASHENMAYLWQNVALVIFFWPDFSRLAHINRQILSHNSIAIGKMAQLFQYHEPSRYIELSVWLNSSNSYCVST